MSRMQKNEPLLDRRRLTMRLYLDDGVTPAPAATPFFWVAASLSLAGLSAVFAAAKAVWSSAGATGNNVQLAFAADGAGAGSVTSSGVHYTFHFQAGVTTAANAVTALATVGINITGTYTAGSTLATPGDVFALHALTGGVDTSIFLTGSTAGSPPVVGEAPSSSSGFFVNVSDQNDNPIDGFFVYFPTQGETNQPANEMTVRVAKPGVKASLDLSTVTTHCNAVIEDTTPGSQGNNTTIAFIADGSGTGTLDESAYPAIAFHYQSGTTTDANFETHVAASVHLDVKTPGTGANVLANPADTFSAHALANGIGYAQATFPIELVDDTFDSIGEGSSSYGDLVRLLVGVIAGKVADFRSGSLAFRNLADSKTRLSVTTDPSGRTSITVGDLTP